MKTGSFLFALLLILPSLSPLTVSAEDPAALEARMRKQLVSQPGDLDARLNLARALSWQAKYAESLTEFERLLDQRPGNPDYLLGAGQTHLWRGAPEDALPLLREARRIAPNYEDVWRAEIATLLAFGTDERSRQASQLNDEARNRFPLGDWSYSQLNGAAEVTRAAPSRAWEAGISSESLSRGLPSWRSRYLNGEWRDDRSRLLYVGFRETVRYGLRDSEIHVGGGLPLGVATQLQLEVGASDSHHVLPARYGQLQVQHQPGAGWSLGAGWRRSSYDSGNAGVINLGVERYFGAERLGYTLYEGGPGGAGLSPSHRWQWDHYYGERNRVGLAVVQGRETEYSAGVFITSRVSGVSLSGVHYLVPDWAITWESGSLRQGDLYTRSGIRLGLRHAF